MIPIPRFKGKVFQVDEPKHKDDGKWGFEIWMTDLGQTYPAMSLGQFGFWKTEEQAKKELLEAAKFCCQQVDKDNTHYIDMNVGGITKRWDKTDQQ